MNCVTDSHTNESENQLLKQQKKINRKMCDYFSCHRTHTHSTITN